MSFTACCLRVLPFVLLTVLSAGIAPAAAQTPLGLKTHFRLVNSMPNQTTPGELRVGDGWAVAGPLVTEGHNHISNPEGMHSNSDFTAVADYGYLHFSGSGDAVSFFPNGCFLWVDDWIGAEPRAQYRDRLFVTSSTLPSGTPVVVQFDLTLSGFATVTDINPSSTFSATFTADHPGTDVSLSLADAPGVTSATLDTFVGDVIDVHGVLRVYMYAYGVMSPGHTASIAADVTAQIDVTPLTAGVSVTSSSAAVDVPEIAASPGLALAGAWPNPVRNAPVTVRFTLPSGLEGEPAVLSLFDVSGRRIAEKHVGSLGAGPHSVGLADGGRLAAGVYYVRLARGREALTSRVVVVD
ncbi:MAG: T9SS type A sorting domain-containing protein [Gemmatimonadetes bacterium]|nr:T9SS type A sorting domain-containing protein [Gemmatimonadota bacterium]